jgi:hypothetical protein
LKIHSSKYNDNVCLCVRYKLLQRIYCINMKPILLCLLLFGVSLDSKSQAKQPLSVTIKRVSDQWKLDSNSCNGYRAKEIEEILVSQIDSVSKEFILSNLGKPNSIQKFYSGTSKKNYVGYIYFVYKDNCPKISVEGYAIQFIFDETETYLIKIDEIEYCG